MCTFWIQWGEHLYCKAKFLESVKIKDKHKLFCLIIIPSFPPTFQLFLLCTEYYSGKDSWLLFRNITVHVLSRSWQHSEM